MATVLIGGQGGQAIASVVSNQIEVNSAASPGGDGSLAAPFNTIMAGVAAVTAGKTLNINGTFSEAVVWPAVAGVKVKGTWVQNGLVNALGVAGDWLEYANDGVTASPGSTLWGATRPNVTRTRMLVANRQTDTRIHGGELGFLSWRKDALTDCKRQGEWYLPAAGTNKIYIKSATIPTTFYNTLEMCTESASAWDSRLAIDMDMSAAVCVFKGFQQGALVHASIKGGITLIQFTGGLMFDVVSEVDAAGTWDKLILYDGGGSGQLDPVDVSSFGVRIGGSTTGAQPNIDFEFKTQLLIDNTKEDNFHMGGDFKALGNGTNIRVKSYKKGASRIGQVGHHENIVDNNSTRSGTLTLEGVHIHNDLDPNNTTIFTATAAGNTLDVKSVLKGPPLEVGYIFGFDGATTVYAISAFGTGTGGIGTYTFTTTAFTQATEIQMYASLADQHAAVHLYGYKNRLDGCVVNSRVPFSEGYGIRGRRGGEFYEIINTKNYSWGADGPTDLDRVNVLTVGSEWIAPSNKPGLRMIGGDLKTISSSFWGGGTGLSTVGLSTKFATGLGEITFGARSALGAVTPGKYTYRLNYSSSSTWLGNWWGYFNNLTSTSAVLNGVNILFYNWTPLTTTTGYVDMDIDAALSPPATITKTSGTLTLMPTISLQQDNYFSGSGPAYTILRGGTVVGETADYAGNIAWDWTGSDQSVRLNFNLQAGTENLSSVNYTYPFVTSATAASGNLAYDTNGKLGGPTWLGGPADAGGPMITYPVVSVSVSGGLALLEVIGHPFSEGNVIFFDKVMTPHQLRGLHHIWDVPDANHVRIIAERCVPDGITVLGTAMTVTRGKPTAASPATGSFSKPNTTAYRAVDAQGNALVATGNRGAYA